MWKGTGSSKGDPLGVLLLESRHTLMQHRKRPISGLALWLEEPVEPKDRGRFLIPLGPRSLSPMRHRYRSLGWTALGNHVK